MAAAGDEGEALAKVAERLCARLGYAEPQGELAAARSPFSGDDLPASPLSGDDAALVAAVRRGLARLAAAAGGEQRAALAARSVGTALDGAELVMRGELVIGNAAQLSALLPSFVFLVVLPVVDQDRALELAERAAVVIEAELGA